MPGSNKYSQRPEEEDPQKVIPTGQSGGSTPPPKVSASSPNLVSLAKPAEPLFGSQQPVSNNQELINVLERQIAENPLETPEQRKKRERREKWEGIIGGISDAASAVSNLIFTTKGAPNMYNPANSMAEAAQRRRDKAQAERDKRLGNYLNYAMTLGKLKDADRGWRFQLQQYKDAQAQRAHDNALADAKAKRDNAMYQLNLDLAQQKIDAAKAAAVKSQIEAQYAEEYQKARVAREQSSSRANDERANYYKNGGSKNGGGSGKDSYDNTYYDIQTERLFDMLTEEEQKAAESKDTFGKISFDKKGAIGKRARKDAAYAKLVKDAYNRSNPDGGDKRESAGQSPFQKREKENNKQSNAEW